MHHLITSKTPTTTRNNNAMGLCLCAPSVFIVVSAAFGLMQPIAQATPPTQPQSMQRLNDVFPKAVEQVLASSRSQDPFLRANAVEAGQHLPQRITPIIQLALGDTHPAVRFAATTILGKLRLVAISPAVIPLLDDPSSSVQAAAMFALHRCGQRIDVSAMARMLTSPDPSVRGNAVMLLGQMNNHNTIAMIKDLANTPLPRASAAQEAIVRLQIAEAIVNLGDDSTLNVLRAGMYSQFDEVRVLAVTMLGQQDDQRMAKAIAQLLAQPPIELQIAAAGTLAQLGLRDLGLAVVLDACDSKTPTHRAQAALTLGYFPNDNAAQMLTRLLNDPHEQVRLSAAAGIIRAINASHTPPPAMDSRTHERSR